MKRPTSTNKDIHNKTLKREKSDKPSSSWDKVTTPSTLEVPLRTATAFLVAATTKGGCCFLAAREKEKD
jgi:hypothetical protein